MPIATETTPAVANPTAAIANGQTSSGAVDLGGTTLCGIHMPAAFTGASITIQAAPTLGGTYQTVQKNNVDIVISVTQGKYVSLTPSDWAGLQFIKIVSASSEGAGRTLTLATRPV